MIKLDKGFSRDIADRLVGLYAVVLDIGRTGVAGAWERVDAVLKECPLEVRANSTRVEYE